MTSAEEKTGSTKVNKLWLLMPTIWLGMTAVGPRRITISTAAAAILAAIPLVLYASWYGIFPMTTDGLDIATTGMLDWGLRIYGNIAWFAVTLVVATYLCGLAYGMSDRATDRRKAINHASAGTFFLFLPILALTLLNHSVEIASVHTETTVRGYETIRKSIQAVAPDGEPVDRDVLVFTMSQYMNHLLDPGGTGAYELSRDGFDAWVVANGTESPGEGFSELDGIGSVP